MKKTEKDELLHEIGSMIDEKIASNKPEPQNRHPIVGWFFKTGIALLICLTVIITVVLSVFLLGTASSINSVSDALATVPSELNSVLAKNPEVAAIYAASANDNVYYGRDDPVMYAVILSALKQMSANGKVDMTYNANFTTVVDRSLEKVNLSCVDEYDYYKIETKVTTVQQQPGIVYRPSNNVSITLYSTTYIIKSQTGEKESKEDGMIIDQRMVDQGCVKFHMEAQDGQYYKCPRRNCAMKEINTVRSGGMLPISLQVRDFELGMNNK